MDLTDPLLITKSQQVNSQEVDFQKKTEDTFPSKFHQDVPHQGGAGQLGLHRGMARG